MGRVLRPVHRWLWESEDVAGRAKTLARLGDCPLASAPSVRPSQDELMLQVASVIATRSTCNRRQVGAVFAMDGRILVTGYAGSPSGMAHCGPECFPEGPPCERTIHAEANAIAWASRHGVRLQGANAYLTLSPCRQCAGLLLQSGVNEVFYSEQYRDITGLELLWDGNIYTHFMGESVA